MNAKSAALLVLLGALLSGLVGPFDRTLSECGINYIQVTFFRAVITTVIIGLVMLIVSPSLFKVKKEHVLLFIILGLCKGMMDVTFLHSQEEVSLSLTTVLQMTAPYFLIAFGVLLFKDKVSKKKIIAVILGTVAACLVSNVFLDSGSITFIGVVLGLVSGITYAVYMLVSSILIDKKYSVLTILFYAFAITSVVAVPTQPMAHSIDVLINNPSALASLFVVAIGCTLLPYMADAYGLKYLDATVITVFSMLEIAVSAILGFLLYNEAMNIWMLIGMVVLLVSMLMINEPKQDHSGEQKEGPPETEASPPPQA